jgi:hypothetical protein
MKFLFPFAPGWGVLLRLNSDSYEISGYQPWVINAGVGAGNQSNVFLDRN